MPSIHSMRQRRRGRCAPSRPAARESRDRRVCSRRSPKARPPRAAGPSRSWWSAPASRVDLDRPQPARGRDVALLQARGEEVAFEIAEEGAAHAGPDDLDGDLAGCRRRVDFGRMDLRDGGGGNRFAETDEEIVDRAAERALDGGDRLAARKGRHPVLQLGEVERHVVADDVGPRRQELAELDIGGAEPVDAPATAGRCAAAADARAAASAGCAMRQPKPRQAGEFVARQAPRRRLRAP